MHRSLARILALPVVSVGVLAGAASAAPAASAASASTDAGGSASITVPHSVITQLAAAEIRGSLGAPASDSTGTATFPVTGGDGDLRVFFGSVDLGGTIVLKSNDRNSQGHTVTLESLQLNLRAGNITAVPAGSSTPVAILDLSGQSIVGPGNTTQTLQTAALDIDPAGAAYLDQTLNTNTFTAGEDIGSLNASWTI